MAESEAADCRCDICGGYVDRDHPANERIMFVGDFWSSPTQPESKRVWLDVAVFLEGEDNRAEVAQCLCGSCYGRTRMMMARSTEFMLKSPRAGGSSLFGGMFLFMAAATAAASFFSSLDESDMFTMRFALLTGIALKVWAYFDGESYKERERPDDSRFNPRAWGYTIRARRP